MDIIRHHNPDIVCLQEVLPQFVQRLVSVPFIRKSYMLSDATGDMVRPYGVLIMTRLHVSHFMNYNLPTAMARTLLVAHATVNERPLLIGTVHLESLANRMKREQQMAIAFPLMKAEKRSMLMGDFNFHHTWPEQAALDEKFIDTYAATHDLTTEPGYTMPQTRRYSAWRPDRIMIQDDPSWSVRQVQIIGNRVMSIFEEDDANGRTVTVDGVVRTPSDHYGLYCELDLES
eukprot:GILJ01001421.1.p1 GENE.GILJ01001421.1~~GILJ01001421.1.p1  ORF type:complete len:231 (+),score=24.07 GILJ01001421.1:333-1025(+)